MAADAAFPHVEMSALLGVAGLILVLAGWAAAKGRLKRNVVVGMRTRAVMRSHETWRVAHRKCAWSIWWSGCVLIGTAGLLLALRPAERWSAAMLLAMSAVVATLILVGAVQAEKAARSVGR